MAFVLGTAEAFPAYSHTQQDYLEAFLAAHPSADEGFARRIFASTGIEHGQSPLPKDKLFRNMSRDQYVGYIRDATQDMGLRAGTACLKSWGGSKDAITHLVYGTMSAVIDAPTMDARLVGLLGLSPHVQRLSVQQMGCLTGFRCMSLACELAKANPEARIMVIVADVRSGMHNQLPAMEDPSANSSRVTIISCALFRDAASAVIVGCQPRAGEMPLAAVLRTSSRFIPNTLDFVVIKDGEDATISWYNSKDLPYAVSSAIPPLVSDLLAGAGSPVSPHELQYAMHPGGPKILDLTQQKLGVTQDRFQASWDFLRQHGNTSGSSNLSLLHNELTRPHSETPLDYIMCIGIGPGLSLEGLLLRRLTPPSGLATSPATVSPLCTPPQTPSFRSRAPGLGDSAIGAQQGGEAEGAASPFSTASAQRKDWDEGDRLSVRHNAKLVEALESGLSLK